MHVNVRIQPRWTFTEVRRAALALSRAVERRAPALASSKWWKEERHGVFLDYNQNAKDRTTCSAYSVRPLPDARVSTPLHWDEVPDANRRTSPCSPCRSVSRPSAIRTRTWICAAGSLEKLLELAARDEAAGLGDAPWPPHFRKMDGEGPRVAPSRAQLRADESRATKMPLIVVANSPDKEAALAGLERWKSETCRGVRAPRRGRRAGRFDARPVVDVDAHSCQPASRAGSVRPPQETPDPDDDPTREWRERTMARASAAGGENSRQLHAAEPPRAARRCTAAAVCRTATAGTAPCDGSARPACARTRLHHQLGAQRLPRKVLALAPAALAARHAMPRPCSSTAAQCFHG